jgi:PAS domain S-box-containing protein
MASSVEPEVTAARVTVRVPTSSIPHFGVLNDVLVSAVAAAHDDRLLSPPTQPEMAEMRAWLCGEIVGQTNAAPPTPWRPATDVRAVLGANTARTRAYRELAASEESLIATDDTSVIVAVTPDVVELLGYRDEADLIGRRVLAVVPARFHQAHIAGTTLHVTNGRDVLLDRWLTVPVVRADGIEVPVGLHVTSRLLAGDVRVFVAHLRLHDASLAPA